MVHCSQSFFYVIRLEDKLKINLIFILIFTTNLISAIEIKMNTGENLIGTIVSRDQTNIYLANQDTLHIIEKKSIKTPKNLRKLNYNSYKLIKEYKTKNYEESFESYEPLQYDAEELNISLRLPSGDIIEGKLVAIDESIFYVANGETLYIIDKDILTLPLHFNEVNQKSYKVIKNYKKIKRPITRNNTFIFAELGGAGFIYSLNVERRIVGGLHFRFGINHGGVPLSFMAVGGKSPLRYELGLGAYIFNPSYVFGVSSSNWYILPSISFSLRYEPRTLPIILKLGVTTLFLPERKNLANSGFTINWSLNSRFLE